VVVTGFSNKMTIGLTRLLPRSQVLKIVHGLMQPS